MAFRGNESFNNNTVGNCTKNTTSRRIVIIMISVCLNNVVTERNESLDYTLYGASLSLAHVRSSSKLIVGLESSGGVALELG